jgi:hypothetical protein
MLVLKMTDTDPGRQIMGTWYLVVVPGSGEWERIPVHIT